MLIVLGGVMGTYEESDYPWLRLEKQFLRDAIEANKYVLGICLGSQMIAEVLGGKVYPHKFQEVGWWKVQFNEYVNKISLFNNLSREMMVFQYHGDTFDLPNDAIRLAGNEERENQAFIYKDRVVGLQYHPEFSEEKLEEIVVLHGDELETGPIVQEPNEFLGQNEYHNIAKTFLFTLLDNYVKKFQESEK